MQTIKINKKISYSLLITFILSLFVTFTPFTAIGDTTTSQTVSPNQGTSVDSDNIFNSAVDTSDDNSQDEINFDTNSGATLDTTGGTLNTSGSGFLDINFNTSCKNLTCHLKNVIAAVEGLILIVISLSVLAFLWGMVKYVKSIDDESRKQAIGTITYGIISLFVMISVWGLVNLLTTSFGFDSSMNSLKNTNINPTSLIKKSS